MGRGHGQAAGARALGISAPLRGPHCSDCLDEGITTVLVCCGQILPSGECCSQPVPGQEYCDCPIGHEAASRPRPEDDPNYDPPF